ncbi:hypothetical protein Tco_0342939, partial [Tanacetum coccineum]
VSQNGASSPIVQTSPSSCHGTAGQSVQGDQSGGADYSGNGGGFKTWVSYSGSATVATPASPKWRQSFINGEIQRGDVSSS